MITVCKAHARMLGVTLAITLSLTMAVGSICAHFSLRKRILNTCHCIMWAAVAVQQWVAVVVLNRAGDQQHLCRETMQPVT